jgi:glutamate synthase (NADPH/NADH) small chain
MNYWRDWYKTCIMPTFKFSDFQFLDTSQQGPEKIPLKERRSKYVEIYKPIKPKLLAKQADRCLDCGNPYCEWECPVHNYIPNWLQLLKEGRIIEAAELCHQTNTLPEVCGRICPQDRLCESGCTLNDGFGAVTIGDAERYIVDTALKMGWRPDLSAVKQRSEKVAVVGAGPAGLACADVLRRNGIGVDVYDKYPEIGGLLCFGIPPFKLEKDIMIRRRTIFEEMGVKFHLNCEIGKDVPFDALKERYDAVFLGMGAYDAVRGQIPGENNMGVYPALDYLIANINHLMGYDGQHPYLNFKGKRVVVLGGGDTAMDCNRTAIRQGAKSVHCVYRRGEEDMPGSRREVNCSKEEGVQFVFNSQPMEIICKANTVHAVRNAATRLSSKNGQSKLEIDADNCSDLKADIVLVAFGFNPSPPEWLCTAGVEVDPGKRVLVQAENTQGNPFETSVPGVFAGGDMVRGADLVVTAIWEGRQAAAGILKRLGVSA